MDVAALTKAEPFADILAAESFDRWRTFLSAAFGQAPDDRELYERCTGRSSVPRPREVWGIVGRRGGKSQICAYIAVVLAVFRRYKVAPGEVPMVMIVAADKKQARVTMGYVSGFLHANKFLEDHIARERASVIELVNGVRIEVHAGNFRALRGHTVVGAVCDEIAFWYTEDRYAHPETEILNALRPSMATVPNSLLVAVSSPYARRGELWRAYKEFYGVEDSDVLVWQADTKTMNPTVPDREIQRLYNRDPARAAAEYGAQFRTDIESFVPLEVVESCTPPGRYELGPISSHRYRAFTDPAGGSGADSFTLAIAHAEEDTTVLDAVREWKPKFSPEQVIEECAALLKSYGIKSVSGDRYAGEFPREQFRKHGITYDVASRSKSDIYRDLLPLLNSGHVVLLDNPTLTVQLTSLERRTARGGRASIDHPPGAHDDVVNAVAGAVVESKHSKPTRLTWGRDWVAPTSL